MSTSGYTMRWPIVVTATTHTPSGRRRTMCRTVEGAGDIEAAMLCALLTRRDRGVPFRGERVTGTTPLGQRVHRVFTYDDTLERD